MSAVCPVSTMSSAPPLLQLPLCWFSGEEHAKDPFRWDFVGKNVVFMAVEGFLYFLVNVLIQYRFFLDGW